MDSVGEVAFEQALAIPPLPESEIDPNDRRVWKCLRRIVEPGSEEALTKYLRDGGRYAARRAR